MITVGRELRQQHPSDLLSDEGRPCRTTNHEGFVAITPDRPWSIPIITWLNNFVSNVLRQNTFKITTKSNDVAYLLPLWRHTSHLNDGSCSFTHPVVKGRSARGTSSGTKSFVASSCRKSDLSQNNLFGIINHHKHIWCYFSEVYVANLNIVALHIPSSEAATTTSCQKSKQSCYIGRYYMWCHSLLSRQSIFMQFPIKIRKPMKCG